MEMSLRGQDFCKFADKVIEHIECYTVPQYGDKGEDQVTGYTAEDCIKQAQKYMARYGRNARPGQQELDFIKGAHYMQLAYTKYMEATNASQAD